MSDWGRGDVQRNWGDDGVAIVDELASLHGYERLLEPVRDETLTDYVQRSARNGLCHVAGNMGVLQDVQARKKAEARGLPVYEIDAIEPDFRGEHLRDLSPHERFDVYKVASITPVLPTPDWARASTPVAGLPTWAQPARAEEPPPSTEAPQPIDYSGLTHAEKFAAYLHAKHTPPGAHVSDFHEE